MKTILLEIDDNNYQTIVSFIKLIPNCQILEENKLSKNEHQYIQNCIRQIEQKDYTEFDDWELVKHSL
ncbi:MAG: hypothetical protein KAI79_08505 [Bacteroidales bacterium]|nr:hypothetical protein [Bacteroidales bacterium]